MNHRTVQFLRLDTPLTGSEINQALECLDRGEAIVTHPPVKVPTKTLAQQVWEGSFRHVW